LSGLKSFYNYMQLEHDLAENPTDLIEAPKSSRNLPDVLSIAEIDALIGAIDQSSTEGTRNKAMLEVLYGCGLRVSELTQLKLFNFSSEIEFYKVAGKGSRDGLAAIGGQVSKYLKIFIEQVLLHQLIKPRQEYYVFINRRGTLLSRVMVF